MCGQDNKALREKILCLSYEYYHATDFSKAKHGDYRWRIRRFWRHA